MKLPFRMLRAVALGAGWLGLMMVASAAGSAGYYRFPALHDDTIVFTAEGDLWRVGVSGGSAHRLTAHPALEQLPAISPDGQQVAFTGQYEGQTEVCVMPLAGGAVTRLTYEGEAGGALVRGWTADGKILYSTVHYSTLPNRQLVAIDPATRERTFVPLAQADEGVYDAGGRTLFFTRLSTQSSHAKRYAGGTAQNLWRFDPGASEARPLTADYAGTSRWPMFWEGRVYFASDRDGTMNLWSMQPDGTDLRQLTRHDDFGVKNPSLHAGRIIYQNGADLWLLNLASGKSALVPITLASDFDQWREKWVAKPLDYVSGLALSPSGDRVALTVRGQVFVAPVTQGRLVEATRQPGVRFRQASFFPDGKSLLALSDESGEVEFWRVPANGVGPREPLTKDGNVLRLRGVVSPDGNWIASAERDQELWLFHTKSGEKRRVAVSGRQSFDEADLAWSPDSLWLAYVNAGSNEYSSIYLYSVGGANSTAVTSERTDSSSPAWSPDGKWLYFLSERSLQSVVRAPWGLRQPEPFFDRPVKIYQLALAAGTRRSPFQPDDELMTDKKESEKKDVERKEPDQKAEGKNPETKKPTETDPQPVGERKAEEMNAKAKAKGERAATMAKTVSPAPAATETKAVSVVVDLKEIASRLWEVPVPAGNYSRLGVTEKTLFFFDHASTAAPEPANRLVAVEIKNKDVETVTIADGLATYDLSDDGKKLLLRRKDDLFVIDAAAKAAPASLDKNKVNLSGLKFSYLPRENWRQIFRDAWRLHRDYFYDAGMHGVDWPTNLAKHLPLVDRVTDRAELNDLLSYMMSEMSALHTAVTPGDVRGAPEEEVAPPASLGARLKKDPAGGGWRIEHIYAADPDYPEQLSPLRRPGQSINDGDVIESINGVAVLSVPDPEALLRNQAGRQVLLRIKPASGEAFEAIVNPINAADAASLRYADWELERRRRVEQAGEGKIGYVHLRAMGTTDYNQWARDFYPVIDRGGLILDLRHNRGGNIDSWVLSRLLRQPWMWWSPRFSDPRSNMQSTFGGHLVVLVNEWTSSDGETTANGVRHLGLGRTIGTRTWGGGIWLRGINTLIDRGVITAAEMGSFIPGEGWVIEGPGFTPDVIVDNNPAAVFRGADPQLDAAVAWLRELIAKGPKYPAPVPPAPMDRTLKR